MVFSYQHTFSPAYWHAVSDISDLLSLFIIMFTCECTSFLSDIYSLSFIFIWSYTSFALSPPFCFSQSIQSQCNKPSWWLSEGASPSSIQGLGFSPQPYHTDALRECDHQTRNVTYQWNTGAFNSDYLKSYLSCRIWTDRRYSPCPHHRPGNASPPPAKTSPQMGTCNVFLYMGMHSRLPLQHAGQTLAI